MKILHVVAAMALGVATFSAPASAVVVVTKKVVRTGPGPRFVGPRPLIVRPLGRPLLRRPVIVRPLVR